MGSLAYEMYWSKAVDTVIKAIGEIIPALKGKLEGVAMRVPTPNVSLVEFIFNVRKNISIQKIYVSNTICILLADARWSYGPSEMVQLFLQYWIG